MKPNWNNTSDHDRTGKLYRKIDIYYRNAGGYQYACSTNWWRTQRDAINHWCSVHNINRLDHSGKRVVIATWGD